MRDQNMIRITERNLYVPMTKGEKEEQSKVLIELLDQNDLIESEKKIAMEAFKKQLSEKESEINNCRAMIKFGTLQLVGCTEYLSEDQKEVYTVRNDTGKEIERRPASDADKQTVLAFE